MIESNDNLNKIYLLLASFQALCEVVNEFAKNENSKIEFDNNEKNRGNFYFIFKNFKKYKK
jgi:hypothetical protein